MKIAFNPSTANALTTISSANQHDIIFDLKGRNIFARGVKFFGTDTQVNIIDNLTSSDSKSALSANMGRYLNLTKTPYNNTSTPSSAPSAYNIEICPISSSWYSSLSIPDSGGGLLIRGNTGTGFNLWLHDTSNVWYKQTVSGAWKKMDAGYADHAGYLDNTFTVFGVAYNGSQAKTVIPSNFVSLLEEGTSTITDGTMLITSYASNNGFADSNAVNIPYKRKASHLWEYINSKTNLLYLPLAGGTMAGTAYITFADSGSWGSGTGALGARGGLKWSGQSDYAWLYAEETAGDNLDLVIKFGDDNSNGLSIRNTSNVQTTYISANGVISTGTLRGNLDWSYITNKPSFYTKAESDARYTRYYNNNNLNIDSFVDLNYIQTAALQGGSWTGTSPSGTHNGKAVLNVHTHTGNFYSLLMLDTALNRLWMRSANNTTTYGSWNKVAYLSDVPTTLKNPYSLTIQTNGTTLGSYDGSAAKTWNITYSNVGAAAANHNHTSLSGVIRINFATDPSDSCYIGTTVTDSTTHLDFYLSDDASQESYRWIFGDCTAVGTKTIMELLPTNNANTALKLYDSYVATQSWTSGLYVTSLGTSGRNLTWTKAGTTNNITVPFATYSSALKSTGDDGNWYNWVYWNGSYFWLKAGTSIYNNNTATLKTAVDYSTMSSYLVDNGSHKETASGTTANATNAGMLYPSGMYMTRTYGDSTMPTSYGNVINVAGGGSGLLLLGWSGSDSTTANIYYRSHRDTSTGGWGSWVTLLATNNYTSILDSRYYIKSEVNNLLNKKLDRVNLTTSNWNPRGYNLAADYHYNGGDVSFAESGGLMHISIDGKFWQNEGLYRVLDTSDLSEIYDTLTINQYLSTTDTAWRPLIWGGGSHTNTNNSTGPVYKSYSALTWQTSSLTLYATKLRTTGIIFPDIGNVETSGKISWNGSTDGADIYYLTTTSDKGNLVLNVRDDNNCYIQLALNGTFKSYFDVANSYWSGKSNLANKWATARTFKIGNTAKTVDGSGDISWTLSEIGVLNTWRQVNVNGTSIGSATLNLTNGNYIGVSNNNGTVTFNLIGSTTTANLAILSNGTANLWKLQTLNIDNWNNAWSWISSITAADTDKVINKWNEILNFLAGIDSSNKLNTLLNSKLSITQIAAKSDISTLKNNAIYWVDTKGNASGLTNGPFTNSPFAMLSITNYNTGTFSYRSRLAFNDLGEIKVAKCHSESSLNWTDTWYNILTSNNSGISGSTIKINGTSITVNSSTDADNKYVKKAGDTMTGVLNFGAGFQINNLRVINNEPSSSAHKLVLGYSGFDKAEWFEWGGIWNFYKMSGTLTLLVLLGATSTFNGLVSINSSNFGALSVKRNDTSNGATIQYSGSSSVYGYIGFNSAAKDKQALRWNSDTSKVYTILDTSSTYISGNTITINGVSTTWSDHTYNFSGTTFVSGNSYTGEHNANNITYNGHFYYTSNGPATSLGATTNDGAIYSQAYSNYWVGQIAQDYRNGRLFIRSKNNGNWLNWLKVLDTGTTYVSNNEGYINGVKITLVSNATNAVNSDTVDSWHKDEINRTLYITSGVSGLSSYWAKFWEIDLNSQYNDLTITFLASASYYPSYFGIFSVFLRQNGSGTAKNISARLVELIGNIALGDSDLRLYVNNSTGNCQLWGNVKNLWGTMNLTVLKKAWRTATDSSNIGTFYSNDFSNVLTLPGTDWNKIGVTLQLVAGVYTPSSHNHDGTYLRLSGADTMVGALKLANGTWNLIGDDVKIGDHNVGGGLGILGANGNTRLDFCLYGNASNYKSITFDGTTLYLHGTSYNADRLSGYSLNVTDTQKPFGKIPVIYSDGVTELGRYIDFHYDNTTNSDYSTRLQIQGNYSNAVNLPTASGTLALTSQIPTVDNYYWANIKISTTSNSQTQPSVNTIYANNWFRSQGVTGWYSETYGGGIYMSDSSWVRVHNNKGFYTGNEIQANQFRANNENNCYLFGNSNARISHVGDQVIFNTGSALRFGSTAWDWNQWAGLKYDSSNKRIYLGIADGSVFNSNSSLSGGSINLQAGIDSLLAPGTICSNASEVHIGHNNSYSDSWSGLSVNFKFGGSLAATHIYSNGGFHKNGSSDSYVLLGGGGHSAISSLSVNNADKLDGYHASGLFTALSNSSNGVSLTIGGTTRSISNIQVGSAITASVLSKNSTFNDSNIGRLSYFDGYISNTSNSAEWSAPSEGWCQIIHNDLSVTNYWTELAFPVNDVNGLAWRQRRDALYYGWYRILDSNNYNNYAPTKTGTGASGTWGININGTATNADKLGGYSASGLFTALSNFNYGVSLTIGGTTKNISNISVNYAKSAADALNATNADKVDGYHVNDPSISSTRGQPFGKIPVVYSDGVMEVGHYLDFHFDNTSNTDFSTRLYSDGNYSNHVKLPSTSGTLALTSLIPTIKWAIYEISVSTSYSKKAGNTDFILSTSYYELGGYTVISLKSSITSDNSLWLYKTFVNAVALSAEPVSLSLLKSDYYVNTESETKIILYTLAKFSGYLYFLYIA